MKLDFYKIEFQNWGISLINLGNGVKCWKVCVKGAFANFLPWSGDKELLSGVDAIG